MLTDLTLSEHYHNIKKHLTHISDWQQYIKLDSAEEGFEKILEEFGPMPISSARTLLPFLVNLDRYDMYIYHLCTE